MIWLSSDNAGPAAPEILAAVTAANEGYTPGYGAEDSMAAVTAQIREIFEAPEAAVYLVGVGTAANALALATLIEPWQTIYCHTRAHIEEDECGAPEVFTGGAKLSLVPGAEAKIDPVALSETLARGTDNFVHNVQRGALSITNVTELGAVYSTAEIAELCKLSKTYNLPIHLDGARIANALVATNASPADMTWRAGIDAISLGGTKNGCLGVEAVVLFDPQKAWEFELRRKRGGHLFSKHRYLSAQMQAYLTDGLWLSLARRANDAALQMLLLPLSQKRCTRICRQMMCAIMNGARRARRAVRATRMMGFWRVL